METSHLELYDTRYLSVYFLVSSFYICSYLLQEEASLMMAECDAAL